MLPSVVGGAAPVRRRGGVGLAGGDVPFPSPPSRRRCAGSGLAPGARGARGEGVSSRHALVKWVVRVDRSRRRWVVFGWYYCPTRPFGHGEGTRVLGHNTGETKLVANMDIGGLVKGLAVKLTSGLLAGLFARLATT